MFSLTDMTSESLVIYYDISRLANMTNNFTFAGSFPNTKVFIFVKKLLNLKASH